MSTYGLLGYPLAVSFSPAYFAEKFERLHLHHRYLLFPRPTVADLRSWIADQPDLAGLNVTIPHKQSVVEQMDDLTTEAKATGAVNTILIQRNPFRLVGHNTDVLGFKQSLRALVGDARPAALVLGTGGAARAVWYVLQALGIPFLKVGRQAADEVLSYASLRPEQLASHPLWINTTPLGMEPTFALQKPALLYEALTSSHLLYDLVYHPAETPFLEQGRKAGAKTQNGLVMLHAQAEASWTFWQNK